MTVTDTDHNPLAAVTALVEDAEDTDSGTLPVALVRATLDGRYRPDRQPEPSPARGPQPGDMVLIPATVEPSDGQNAADLLTVTVSTWVTPTELTIRADTVHEVLGPPWWPPQPGDVVLDRTGHVWEYDGPGTPAWFRPGVEMGATTQELDDQAGPLALIARDRKRYDG